MATFTSNGTPITAASPQYDIPIISNNGVLKARHQSGLPLGYTLLDYATFDGTQEIDTGFTPDNDSRIESKCYRTGDDCWIYGASASNPRVTLYHSRTGTSRWGNQSRNNFGFSANTEYILVQDKNGLSINGVNSPWNSGTAGDFTCDRSLTIGNCNGATGSTLQFSGNLYYVKIYDNNVLVRDFVPCKNASNVVGLYDKVNGVFYTDTGLGAGSTVSDPVEVYADGLQETINIHTKNLFDEQWNRNTGVSTQTATYGQVVAANGWSTSALIPVQAGQQYTVSYNTVVQLYVFYYESDGTMQQSYDYATSNTKKTFTVPNGATHIRLQVNKSTEAAIADLETQLEVGSTNTAYVPYFNGGTATCEDLLSVGTYTDEQEVISGGVTRKVGVKVLDGTEDWTKSGNLFYAGIATDALEDTHSCYCTHFKGVATDTSANYNDEIKVGTNSTQTINWTRIQIYPVVNTFSNATALKTWLADQYAAGHPVIIVYPLSQEITEQVTPQPMQTTDGDNTCEITQASMSGLELSVKYIKGA